MLKQTHFSTSSVLTHSTDTAHNTIDGPFLVSLSNNKLTKKLVRQVRAVVVEKPDYFTNWVVKLS